MSKKDQVSFDRVERSLIPCGSKNHKAVSRICQIGRSIYNRTNYMMRNDLFSGKKTSDRDVDKRLKKGADSERDIALYKLFPSGVAQRTTQLVGQDWKSYREAKKEFDKNPQKFLGRPKLPKYKKSASTVCIPRNSFKVVGSEIHFAKSLGLEPLPITMWESQEYNSKASETAVKEVRIVPLGNRFVFEVVFDWVRTNRCGNAAFTLLDKSRVLGIDLGLDRLATLASNQPDYIPVLINGRWLKRVNALYNKQCAELRSLKKGKHLKAKSTKRHFRIHDYLHKVSNFILQECLVNNFGKVVIGHNTQWKQEINIGKRNNQNFVSIPHAKLIWMLKYKLEQYGIEVVTREESYTSKASAADLDPIPSYGDKVIPLFSGKRVKRGLYRTKSGKLLNADVNGAINIIRKECGDAEIVQLFTSGCVYQPRVQNFVDSKSQTLRSTSFSKTALAA